MYTLWQGIDYTPPEFLGHPRLYLFIHVKIDLIMKIKLECTIKKNTVSTTEIFSGFTAEQNKIVEAEIKYYNKLVAYTLNKKL